MLTRIRKRLERWGALLVYRIANVLPRYYALRLAEALAILAYYILGRFRKTALDNVNIAFGNNISESRKREIVKLAFKNLGKTMVDFMRFARYSREDILKMAKRVEGLEYLERAMADSPGGVIGLTGHFGSWEFCGAWLVAKGFLLAAVGKEQPDKELTKLMLSLRQSVGIEHIPRTKQGNKAIIQTLNSKKILGLLADQNGGKDGIFVPFFGKMASCFKGPAQLAVKKKVPVLLIIALWEGDDYVIRISPPVEIVDTGDSERDLYENTLRCQKVIEDAVREFPEQWLWGHKRWKTRPPDEVSSGHLFR